MRFSEGATVISRYCVFLKERIDAPPPGEDATKRKPTPSPPPGQCEKTNLHYPFFPSSVLSATKKSQEFPRKKRDRRRFFEDTDYYRTRHPLSQERFFRSPLFLFPFPRL